MHWLLVFSRTSLSNCFIAACLQEYLTSSWVLQVIYLQLLHIYNIYKNIRFFMYLLFVFFRMSNCSCFIAAMFAKVLESFTNWLLVFFKTSLSNCYLAAMFARVFYTFMSFLLVFCKWSICDCFNVQYLQGNWTPSCTYFLL